MEKYVEEIRRALAGKHPLIYVLSPEEDRILGALRELAGEFFQDETAVSTWSCMSGLSPGAEASKEPVAALEQVIAAKRQGFFVMKDLSAFMNDPAVVRALRDAYYALKGKLDKVVVIISADLVLPTLLEKEVCLVEVAPPQAEELLAEALKVEADYPGLSLSEDLQSEIAVALKGLTLNEVRHTMNRVFSRGGLEREEVLDEIFREKEMIVKKSGFLEFVPPRVLIENIGGLDTLKDWLVNRQNLFTREAMATGLPVPRGILLMGVSGCGKSFSAKAVSALWNVPLFRLDMNLVFSGLYGQPEAAFHKALKTVEAVAPVVLWIDEIENGLTAIQDSTGSQIHLFSAFLTWMQEKPPLIFIVATANRIEALPAEVIRKGRFDQVFFCDLPNEEERREIIEIHLRLNGADPAEFRMEYLEIDTDGWNGAEIEQAIIAARIDAYQEGRKFETKDITRNTSKIIPLSQTMSEQIKGIREWAFGRATPASKFTKFI